MTMRANPTRQFIDKSAAAASHFAGYGDKKMEAEMANGTVKWFNDAKGVGFIEPDGGGADIFAHFSAIAMEGFKTLKQGSRVRFEVTAGPKGQLAQDIHADDADSGHAEGQGQAQAVLTQGAMASNISAASGSIQ